MSVTEAPVSVVDRQWTAPIDPLWLQDAGSTLVDPVGLVMDWLAAHHADTLELAILHGGTDGDLAGSDPPAAALRRDSAGPALPRGAAASGSPSLETT